MDVPETLRYTVDHEWLRLDGDEATVGITAYATEELGDIVFVELPAVGRRLAEGEPFGVIESVKTASDLYAPMGGEVLAVNEALGGQPELVNAEPYGAGWMLRLRPDDPQRGRAAHGCGRLSGQDRQLRTWSTARTRRPTASGCSRRSASTRSSGSSTTSLPPSVPAGWTCRRRAPSWRSAAS